MKKNKPTLISLVSLILFVALTSNGCVNLDVLSKKCESTTVKTAGEDDYAFKCTVQVRNKGVAGKVRAIVELHTPEGQFYREQVVNMASEEVRTFEFIFTEPTVPGTMLNDDSVRYLFRYEEVK
jgi:hypothetical protein